MADQVQDATDLIAQMKKAVNIVAAEAAGTKGSALVDAIELDLEGAVTVDAEGNFKFTIFGHELGVEGSYTKEKLLEDDDLVGTRVRHHSVRQEG